MSPVCPFGEHVRWKVQPDRESRDQKAESDWSDGVFMGIYPLTGEAIIGTSDGVVFCRTVRRCEDSEMWSMPMILDVKESYDDKVVTGHGETQMERMPFCVPESQQMIPMPVQLLQVPPRLSNKQMLRHSTWMCLKILTDLVLKRKKHSYSLDLTQMKKVRHSVTRQIHPVPVTEPVME